MQLQAVDEREMQAKSGCRQAYGAIGTSACNGRVVPECCSPGLNSQPQTGLYRSWASGLKASSLGVCSGQTDDTAEAVARHRLVLMGSKDATLRED